MRRAALAKRVGRDAWMSRIGGELVGYTNDGPSLLYVKGTTVHRHPYAGIGWDWRADGLAVLVMTATDAFDATVAEVVFPSGTTRTVARLNVKSLGTRDLWKAIAYVRGGFVALSTNNLYLFGLGADGRAVKRARHQVEDCHRLSTWLGKRALRVATRNDQTRFFAVGGDRLVDLGHLPLDFNREMFERDGRIFTRDEDFDWVEIVGLAGAVDAGAPGLPLPTGSPPTRSKSRPGPRG